MQRVGACFAIEISFTTSKTSNATRFRRYVLVLKDTAVHFLYWARKELCLLHDYFDQQKELDSNDSQALFEIQAALQFISLEWGFMLNKLKFSLPKEISFEYLWAILPPDSLVVNTDALNNERVYRVLGHSLRRTQQGVELELALEYADFNHRILGSVRTSSKIPAYEGLVALQDLPVMPLKFYPDVKALKIKILNRTSMQLRYYKDKRPRVQQHVQQDNSGLGLVEGKDSLRRFNEYDSHIWTMFLSVHSKVTSLGVTNTLENLTEEQRLLFPGRVYGYSLGDETWGAFSVDSIADVKWDDNILSSLVMDADIKETLIGIIETHVQETSGFDDFVRGKGKGLIGLLSGPPGAGKTLTAEAVAERAHMPLYMVSSGSLGSTATSVANSLSHVLHLADHWKAVLLLDEADVFLARRSLQDLERNAVVSVFLRELEYYQGIMLLTTNLPDIVDEAFESRIHFFHHYTKLDATGRETVWRNFARSATGIKVDIDDAGYSSIGQLDLNGRQIKNVMSISVKLAIAKKERTLTPERIITTARTLQKGRGTLDSKAQGAVSAVPPKPKTKPSRLTGEKAVRDAAIAQANGETVKTG
ncbi:hypothetical protein K4K54_001809 [Colletotrichum sp. SAR 10_86]|nr:hypothetical protein K4K54_001809 [Colletotrichum sp. SAR 10_86]